MLAGPNHHSAIDLLLCSARVQPTPDTTNRIREIILGVVDWKYLLELATEHGLSALLFRSLSAFPDIVPEPHYAELKAAAEHVAARNRLKARETVRLLDVFNSAGLKAVPFKGSVLSVTAYRDLSLRQFGDIDLLMKHEEIARAYNVLFADGYGLKHKGAAGQSMEETKFHCFLKEKNWFVVDIQSTIEETNFSLRIDQPVVWDRLQTAPLADANVPTLSPEDNLLILCVHGSKHLWERILWISDVAESVRSYPDMDVNYLRRRSLSLGVNRMLELGLVIARDLLNSSEAHNLLRALGATARMESSAKFIARRLHEQRGKTEDVERSLFYLGLTDSFWNRLKYRVFLCYSLQMPQYSESVGAGMVLLYYVVTPCRWILKRAVRSDKIKQSFASWLERFG